MIRRKRLFTDEEIDKLGVSEKEMRATLPANELYRLRFYLTHEKPMRRRTCQQHKLNLQRIRDDKQNIIKWYDSRTKTVLEMSKEYKVSRQAIYKTLKKAGVLRKQKEQFGDVFCSTCNAPLVVHLYRIRKQKRHFCNRTCYIAWMEALGDDYKPNRRGQRLSRQAVAKVFDLRPEYIVHHEDKNCWNYALHNLKVFKNQGDHVRYHRGFEVEPIWNGAKYPNRLT